MTINPIDLALGILIGALAAWVYVLLWKVGYTTAGAGRRRAAEPGGDRGQGARAAVSVPAGVPL